MTDEAGEAHPPLLLQEFLHFPRPGVPAFRTAKRRGRARAYSKSASGADPYAVSVWSTSTRRRPVPSRP